MKNLVHMKPGAYETQFQKLKNNTVIVKKTYYSTKFTLNLSRLERHLSALSSKIPKKGIYVYIVGFSTMTVLQYMFIRFVASSKFVVVISD